MDILKSNLSQGKIENYKNSLENIFPIEFIENHKTITKNGCVSVGFELQHLAFRDSVSEDDFQNMHYIFCSAVAALPPGTFIHKIDIFYEESFQKDRLEEDFFMKRKINHFLFRPILRQKSYLFIGFSEPKNSFNSSQTFFATRKKRFSDLLFGIDEKLSYTEKLGSQFQSILSQIEGISLKRMLEEDLLRFYNHYLNLDFSKSSPIHKPISNDRNRCMVGNEILNIISMIGQGPEVYTSTAQKNGIHGSFIEPLFAELSFPHIVNQCLQISDTEKELQKLDVLRNLVNSFTGLRDQASELHESGLSDLSKEIRQSGNCLVRFHLNVMVFDSNPTIQNQKVNQVITQLSSLNGTKSMIENLDTCNLFFSMMGGNLNENFRWILVPVQNAACYFAFTGPYMGDSDGILICNRNREPIHLNFWNDRLENKNKIVVGPSGSGKSFAINTLITQHYSDKEEVVIIDIGGSYKGLFQAIKGKYIEYKNTESLVFNPFIIFKDHKNRWIPSSEKTNFLITLLVILWKGDTYELSKIEKSLLGKLIRDYYDFFNAELNLKPELSNITIPCLSGFYTFLKNALKNNSLSEEFTLSLEYLDLKSLLIVLYDFTDFGTYPNLLNAPNLNLLSDHPLVCFDLQGIKEDSTLFPIISLLIIELILDKIRESPSSRKHIYMDEAWSMLKDALGDFIMNMFRTIRKSNGAITIITQGIDEIEKSLVGRAILQNAATKIILDHHSVAQFYPQLQTSLGLTEHEMLLLKSIRKNDLEGWREIFVKFGNQSQVLVLEPSPEEKIAFDSKIESRLELGKFLEKYNYNFELSIDQFNENKSHDPNR